MSKSRCPKGSGATRRGKAGLETGIYVGLMYQWSCTSWGKWFLGENVQRENRKQSPEREMPRLREPEKEKRCIKTNTEERLSVH